MWSSFPNIIRASCRSSIQCKKYGYQVCSVRQYSSGSNIPDLPTEGTGLPPTRRPDVPFVTIYDQFPKALQLYKLNNMATLASLSSVKRLMFPAGIFLISYTIIEELQEAIEHEMVVGCAIGLMSFMVSYFCMTIPLRNFVGFLYIDQETEEIIVSSVDFWGRRRDKKFEPGDLYFKARNNILDKMFIFLISRETGEKFRINFRFAHVFSQQLIEENFGRIPDSVF